LRPLFLALEGIDGSGTTTQCQRLQERLRAQGHEPVLTREPGGTPAGERIREILLDPELVGLDDIAELLLYGASRRQLVTSVIAPALGQNKPVISDRYALSTLAYQGVARGIGLEASRQVNQLAMAGTVPDLTLLLDIDPMVGLQRRKGRQGPEDRLESEGLDFQRRVRDAYLRLAHEDPTVLVVDAHSDEITLENSLYSTLIRRFPSFPFESAPSQQP
jgi:dTMP kinase